MLIRGVHRMYVPSMWVVIIYSPDALLVFNQSKRRCAGLFVPAGSDPAPVGRGRGRRRPRFLHRPTAQRGDPPTHPEGMRQRFLRPFRLHLLVMGLQGFGLLPFPTVLLNVIRQASSGRSSSARRRLKVENSIPHFSSRRSVVSCRVAIFSSRYSERTFSNASSRSYERVASSNHM